MSESEMPRRQWREWQKTTAAENLRADCVQLDGSDSPPLVWQGMALGKEFEVRETKTKMLKRANDTAMRRVLTSAIRTEYANVPIK